MILYLCYYKKLYKMKKKMIKKGSTKFYLMDSLCVVIILTSRVYISLNLLLISLFHLSVVTLF